MGGEKLTANIDRIEKERKKEREKWMMIDEWCVVTFSTFLLSALLSSATSLTISLSN
jgi:hypothetical protein